MTNATCRLSVKRALRWRNALRLARAGRGQQTHCRCRATLPHAPPARTALPAPGLGREARCASIAPRPDDVFLEIGPGAGALTLPLAARCRARRGGRDRRAARRALCARRARRTSRSSTADALAADLRRARPARRPARRQPALLRLEPAAAALPRPARPRARPARDAAGRGGAPRRLAAGLEGVRHPLGALRALGGHRHPRALPAGRLRRRRRRSAPRCCAPASATSPRAESPTSDGFERFLQKAFARRRRTLENNLEDSYPNLKEYLRFLNVEGSRRAETLSVVEFAATLASSCRRGHRGRGIDFEAKPTATEADPPRPARRAR